MEKSAEQRQQLYSILGDLPPRHREVSVEKVKEEENATYILETLSLDLNGSENVPAYFIKPKNTTAKVPVILYNHAHGGNYELGKDELLCGAKFLQKPPFAEEFINRGYAILSIDAWGFGERRGRTESELFKQMLWSGQVMWGMMAYDSMKAIDYLSLRPDVDINRIGTVGISMGGTMAWWVSALDERIKVCIDLCSLIDFQALIDTRSLDRHGIYFYVPGLLKYFSTADIHSLIAPRPHLSLAGNYDLLTPAIGWEKIDKKLKAVYQSTDHPGAWELKTYNSGHYETAMMRREVLAFFQKWL